MIFPSDKLPSTLYPDEPKSDFEKLVLLQKYCKVVLQENGVLQSERDELKDKIKERDKKHEEAILALKEKIKNQQNNIRGLELKIIEIQSKRPKPAGTRFKGQSH